MRALVDGHYHIYKQPIISDISAIFNEDGSIIGNENKAQKPAAAIPLPNKPERAIPLQNRPEPAIADAKESEAGESQEVEDVDEVEVRKDMNVTKAEVKEKLKELKAKFGKKILLKLVKGL